MILQKALYEGIFCYHQEKKKTNFYLNMSDHGKNILSSRYSGNKVPICERDGAATKLNLKDRIQGEEKHGSFSVCRNIY